MSWGGGEEFKTGVTPIQFAKTEKINKNLESFQTKTHWIFELCKNLPEVYHNKKVHEIRYFPQ